MGGQPGKPKPIGNPPIRYEPQRPPIEEPPKPIPPPPVERPPYQRPCDRRPKIAKHGSANRPDRRQPGGFLCSDCYSADQRVPLIVDRTPPPT